MNNKEKLEWLHFAISEAINGNIGELSNALQIVEQLREPQTDAKYTYIYGDECSDIWNSLGFTIHDDDDRIKLQFVKYEERGSYD